MERSRRRRERKRKGREKKNSGFVGLVLNQRYVAKVIVPMDLVHCYSLDENIKFCFPLKTITLRICFSSFDSRFDAVKSVFDSEQGIVY